MQSSGKEDGRKTIPLCGDEIEQVEDHAWPSSRFTPMDLKRELLHVVEWS
jgi:hypothetical protein